MDVLLQALQLPRKGSIGIMLQDTTTEFQNDFFCLQTLPSPVASINLNIHEPLQVEWFNFQVVIDPRKSILIMDYLMIFNNELHYKFTTKQIDVGR